MSTDYNASVHQRRIKSTRMKEWLAYLHGILQLMPDRIYFTIASDLSVGDEILAAKQNRNGFEIEFISEITENGLRTNSNKTFAFKDSPKIMTMWDHSSAFVHYCQMETFNKANEEISKWELDDEFFLPIKIWKKSLVNRKKDAPIIKKLAARRLWETTKKRKLDQIRNDPHFVVSHADKIQKLESALKTSAQRREEINFDLVYVHCFDRMNNHIFFYFMYNDAVLPFLFRKIPFNIIVKYDLLGRGSPDFYTLENSVLCSTANTKEDSSFWNILAGGTSEQIFREHFAQVIIIMLKSMSLQHFFSCISRDPNGFGATVLFSPFFAFGDTRDQFIVEQADTSTFLWIRDAVMTPVTIEAESEDFDSSEEHPDLEVQVKNEITYDDLVRWIQLDPKRICRLPLRAPFQRAAQERNEKLLICFARYSPKEPDNIFKILPPEIFEIIFKFL